MLTPRLGSGAVDVPGVGLVVVGGWNDNDEPLSTAELLTGSNTESSGGVNFLQCCSPASILLSPTFRIVSS
uniref:Secreted protein n=1 Tax=Mesocestoides corti TaxID=53468 RepID=A0A5K3FKM3_MESCO